MESQHDENVRGKQAAEPWRDERRPNVLMLNQHDESGGAARAAMRLAVGLRQRGAEVRMAVQQMDGDRHWTMHGQSPLEKLLSRALPRIDRLPNTLYPKRSGGDWSNNWFPNDLRAIFEFERYDLLHLHGVGGGFLPLSSLAKIDRPMVWTLHDMWGFSGGCHYAGACMRYEDECGRCPELGSNATSDLSARNLRAKRKAYRGKQLHVVSPSRWLAARARSSALFRELEVSVIPNGIDLDVFRPVERRIAREILGFPQEARILVFGAVNALRDERKGFSLLCAAIGRLTEVAGMQLVVFGSSEPPDLPDVAVPIRFMGRLSDDATLACLYSSADAHVLPSRQENLANTVMEAMACGTPSVAFEIGGNADLVDHGQTGYLARPFDVGDLAAGISWALGDRAEALSKAARRKCKQKFGLDVVCAQYRDLYRRAIAGHHA